MSKLGNRMIPSATEAPAYVQGKASRGFVVHTPAALKALRISPGLEREPKAVHPVIEGES